MTIAFPSRRDDLRSCTSQSPSNKKDCLCLCLWWWSCSHILSVCPCQQQTWCANIAACLSVYIHPQGVCCFLSLFLPISIMGPQLPLLLLTGVSRVFSSKAFLFQANRTLQHSVPCTQNLKVLYFLLFLMSQALLTSS